MQNRKKTLVAAAFIFGAIAVSAQKNALEGHWEGAITRLGAVQPLRFDFIQAGDSLDVRVDDPAQGYYDRILEGRQKIGSRDTVFDIDFGYGKFHCWLNTTYGQITGFNKDWKPEVLFNIKRLGETEPPPYVAEDVSFSNGEIKLAGSIYKPKITGKYPLVILIHGSDAQTRQTPYIRGLVHNLTKNNIGVVVYDKRGAGESNGNASLATFDDLSGDVSACIRYSKNRNDLPVSKIGIFATSAGGWIAPGIASQWSKTVEFVILNAGPAVSVFEQDVNRVEYTMRSNGMNESTIDSALRHSRLYFDVVKKNTGWEQLQRSVAVFTSKDWAKEDNLLQLPGKMNDDDMIWWRAHNFDPAYDLSHLKCRVLSIMCEKDVLVPPAANKDLMERYLTSAHCRHKIIVLPNAGHSGIAFQTLIGGEWKWPEHYWIWPQRPALYYDEIIKWIKGSD